MEPREDPDDTNVYFRWDLKLPKHRGNELKEELSDHSHTKLPQFNFLQKLEVIFQKDLRANNPWFKYKYLIFSHILCKSALIHKVIREIFFDL